MNNNRGNDSKESSNSVMGVFITVGAIILAVYSFTMTSYVQAFSSDDSSVLGHLWDKYPPDYPYDHPDLSNDHSNPGTGSTGGASGCIARCVQPATGGAQRVDVITGATGAAIQVYQYATGQQFARLQLPYRCMGAAIYSACTVANCTVISRVIGTQGQTLAVNVICP